MSLDGAYLHLIKNELTADLIGSRIEKIHQPAREELVLTLHTRNGTKKLLISANPATARVCVTSAPSDNPGTPPMFCQLLRKRIGGGKLMEIKQDGFERILFFRLLCRNDIGDEEVIILTVEIMGRASNIVLLIERDGELRVIDAVKRVTDEVSAVRRILPGLLYEMPPRQPRLSLTEFTQAQLQEALHKHSCERLDKALIKIFEGICPLFAREAEFRSGGNPEKLSGFLRSIESPQPTMLLDEAGKPFDFTFTDIKQYGNLMTVKHFNSASALLDAFYSGRTEHERIRQRSGSLFKTLNSSYERTRRKLEARKLELEACANRDKLKNYGDLINANLYRIVKGASSFTAQDFHTNEDINIPLDKKLTPAQNAQKYYAEYKKLQNAERILTDLIADSEQELVYLDSVNDAAARAVSDADMLEIKRELIETGYLKSSIKTVTGKNPKQEKPAEPLRFVSSDGATILVGRNNRQNDRLTLKTAKPDEYWLHAKDFAGSHVIVKSSKPSEGTLEEAAVIAAYCSKARESSRVPVDYTQVRYVKKPAGAKPGMVIFTHNKTLYVTPSEEVYNRLKD